MNSEPNTRRIRRKHGAGIINIMIDGGSILRYELFVFSKF
jgi:hypothetical protein